MNKTDKAVTDPRTVAEEKVRTLLEALEMIRSRAAGNISKCHNCSVIMHICKASIKQVEA